MDSDRGPRAWGTGGCARCVEQQQQFYTSIVRGKPAPSCFAADAATLARFRSHAWRIARDGRSFACSHGTEIRQASVIVQLYATALPIAVAAFDREQAAKAQRRRITDDKRNLAGLDPLPPDEPTPEERSWQGGPGFSVQLANATLDAMLADEQSQGFAYTAAVVGDGSWDPRAKRLSRAALLHTGTRLGGALDADDLIGGTRDNYDAELAHRVDAFARLEGQRVFYVFDSTSPILAGEHFRRLSLPARSRMLCDDWLAWAMAFEQRLETLTYWWSHSHCGHLPEAAVDALAKSFLSGEPVPLPRPREPSRHRSIRHYAKGSERDLMLHVYNLHVVRTRYTTPSSMFARPGCLELLRVAKLNDQQRSTVLAVRDDRVRLLGSRVFRDTGPHSLGAVLTQLGCPCGKGRQTVEHVLWECELSSVATRRASLLTPACVSLGTALDRCEPVTRDHAASSIVRRALERGRRPEAYRTLTGAGTPTSVSRDEANRVALAHVLGIIQEPLNWFRPTIQLARPLLHASLAMIAAAIQASTTTLRTAILTSRRRTILHRALQRLRYQTWTHPKPAGTPCRCCTLPGSLTPGVHVLGSRRPIDGARAVHAVVRREGVRVQGPPQLSSIRSFVVRTREEAYLASSAALSASFHLLQDCVARDDDAAVTLARANDAQVLADALDAAELSSARARADAERALDAYRTAAIAAANAVRLSTAADARYRDLDSHAHRVSDFTSWAAQHVSGLIRDSQRAAVRSHRAQKAAAAARAAATPRLTPAERRVLTVQRKRRRQEEQEAVSTIQSLLAKRRLDACPGAADLVDRARAAARRRRACVTSLDDRVRATRRSAIVASYTALRHEVQGAQHAAQEIVLRMRTAARDKRRGVLAWRLGHGGPPRAGYEWRVRIRLVGVTPPRRSRVRAAAAEAAANSGPIGTTGIQSGEVGHQTGADASPALSLPPSFAD